MQQLKAIVRNGRLVLDEPTDLPDGTQVELVALEGAPRLARAGRGTAWSPAEDLAAWAHWGSAGPQGPIEDEGEPGAVA